MVPLSIKYLSVWSVAGSSFHQVFSALWCGFFLSGPMVAAFKSSEFGMREVSFFASSITITMGTLAVKQPKEFFAGSAVLA